MGFFDKVKNMFTEEVEEEVKVEQVKKEVTHVSIESPKEVAFDISEDLDLGLETENTTKPVFFDDSDFRDLNLINEDEELKLQEEAVFSKPIEEKKEVKKVFKPTPIISPVYGILDKNYHKEDIVSRTDTTVSTQVDELSIDSIRNKAYGTLEDELENTLFGNNSVLFKQLDNSKDVNNVNGLEKIGDDVLTTLTDDISKELDELLLKKEKYLDKKDNKEEALTEDLLDFIDTTLYKDGNDE